MSKNIEDYGFIQLRIKQSEKDIISYRASSSGQSITEYILRKVIPEKYNKTAELEEQWKSEIAS